MSIPTRKGKGKGSRNRGNPTPGISSSGIPNQVRRQPPRPKITTLKNGDLCIHNSEPWGDITTGAGVLLFDPGNSNLRLLDNQAKNYDQYCIKSVKIEYKTASGTTTSGDIVMGVDYNTRTVDTSYNSVSLLEPKWVGPIWNNGVLNVNARSAMKNMSERQTSTVDSSAGPAFQIVWNANSSQTGLLGRIWITYNVCFNSPKSATPPSGNLLAINHAAVISSGTGATLVGDDEGTLVDAANNVTIFNSVAQGLASEPFITKLEIATPSTYSPNGGQISGPPTLKITNADDVDITDHFRITPVAFKYYGTGYGGFWSWICENVLPILEDIIVEVIVAMILDTGVSNEAQSALLTLQTVSGVSVPNSLGLKSGLQTGNFAIQTGPICVFSYDSAVTAPTKYGFTNIYPGFTAAATISGTVITGTIVIPTTDAGALKEGTFVVYGSRSTATALDTITAVARTTPGPDANTVVFAPDSMIDLGYNGHANGTVKLLKYHGSGTIQFRLETAGQLFIALNIGFEFLQLSLADE
jgi:hypothetical protein